MIKYWILTGVGIFAMLALGAQSYQTASTVDGRVKKRYEKALELGRARDYSQALRELDAALKDSPTFIDALIVRAAVLANQQKWAEAEAGFEQVIQLDPAYEPQVFYEVAQAEISQEKFDEAEVHLRKALTADPPLPERLRKRVDESLSTLSKQRAQSEFAARARRNPVPFNPKNLGPSINTPGYEYLPCLSADGRYLIYTARENNQEDLFISEKVDGEWQSGRPIEGINTPLNEAAQTISADGKLLVFTAEGRRDGFGGFDLYFSEQRNGRWTAPRNLGQPINTSAWELQPSLSADGRTLYFTSNRKGTLGGSDIWVSRRQADGSWAEPENLGAPINTAADDEAPFIHPDGRTLYFMSKGHIGMGGFDLFLSRLQPEGRWGEPQNLGYPINTEANEGALFVALDGRTAFFASDRIGDQKAEPGSRPTDDIYTFELHPAAQASPVTYVRAAVRDAQSGDPLAAQVELVDLSSGQVYASAQTGADGSFLVCLPLGSDYALNVARKDYLFHSENFALADISSADKPFLLEIALERIPAALTAKENVRAKPVVLHNVFFETGSAALKPVSRVELDRLYQLLANNPGLNIQINGHTDNVGAEVDNQRLSENRARAVYDYLIGKGISEKRLRYAGFGESRPIDDNNTPMGRQRNRRTEFELIN